MPTINDVTVVASAYTTSASARPQRLSNGWIVTLEKNGNTDLKLQISKDNGTTFQDFCSIAPAGLTAIYGMAISSYGTFIHITTTIADGSNFRILYYNINALTQTNVVISVSTYSLEGVTQTAFSGCSLAINSTGTELHATWSCKNATYPNSFNLRVSKGTIAVDGSVTWGTVTQNTINNTVGADNKNPTIIIKGNGYPTIIWEFTNGSNYWIYFSNFNGSIWSNYASLYTGGTYAQSSPSAIFVPQAINGLANGLTGNAWHGTDSASAGVNYIRFNKCVDGIGSVWSTMQKLVVGTNASLTANKTGKLFITYEDAGITKRIESTDNGDTWSVATTVGTGVNPSTLFDLTMNMTIPLTIRKGASSVLFSGSWTVTTISVTQGSIGTKSDKSNLLTYAITTDGTMSTITESVNGVSVGTKTLSSGASSPVGLSQAQWDAIKYGKYAPFINLTSVLSTDWEQGSQTPTTIGQTVTQSASTVRLRTKIAIPVQSNTTYAFQVNSPYQIEIWETNSSNVITQFFPWTTGGSFTTSSGVSFVYVVVSFVSGLTIIPTDISLVSPIFKSGIPLNTLTVAMGTDTFTYTFSKTLATSDDITSAMKAVQDTQTTMLPSVKAKLGSAIRAKGGTVNDTDSFDLMVSAITNASNVKSASGTFTAVGTTVTVTGLSFTPGIVSAYYTATDYSSGFTSNGVNVGSKNSASVFTVATFVPNASGFTLTVPSNVLYSWKAKE